MSPFHLVDAVLGAKVAGRQVGGHRQVLLIGDDSAIPEQRQPRRAHCMGGEQERRVEVAVAQARHNF